MLRQWLVPGHQLLVKACCPMLGHATGGSAARNQDAFVELPLPACWTLLCKRLMAAQKLGWLYHAALRAADMRKLTFAALVAGERR